MPAPWSLHKQLYFAGVKGFKTYLGDEKYPHQRTLRLLGLVNI